MKLREDRWMSPWTPSLETALRFRRQIRFELGKTNNMGFRKEAQGRKGWLCLRDKKVEKGSWNVERNRRSSIFRRWLWFLLWKIDVRHYLNFGEHGNWHWMKKGRPCLEASPMQASFLNTNLNQIGNPKMIPSLEYVVVLTSLFFKDFLP